MAYASRTVNPLHFEDLEPHRFEDLIRQLAYGFRNWSALEATGRLGADGGLDIRGVESADHTREMGGDEDPSPDDPDDLPSTREFTPREWAIQCKRYKEIGPRVMRQVVKETIPDPSQAPYGLIVAAACDVSAQTMAAFRSEALARGVTEAHLWTRAHLEDLLFRPDNDHLLFAYFGLSLRLRRRSQGQLIRAHIALKRKLLRAFNMSEITSRPGPDTLVRDVDDTHYPSQERVAGFSDMSCPPWHVTTPDWFNIDGVWLCRWHYHGWVKPDGAWDVLEQSKWVTPRMGADFLRTQYGEQIADHSARNCYDTHQLVPESERRHIREVWDLPFSSIIEVDPIGDPAYAGVHLYCRYSGPNGPYSAGRLFVSSGSFRPEQILDPDMRQPLFSSLPPASPTRVANDLLE